MRIFELHNTPTNTVDFKVNVNDGTKLDKNKNFTVR